MISLLITNKLIDGKDETHFALDRALSKDNLEHFITDFWERNLARIRRSHSKASTCPQDRICVQEISASNFESVVLNRSSDTLLFYRKKNCVFCDVGVRFFLRVFQMFDKYLSNSKTSNWTHVQLPSIQFVTIDGEENDLPWQFTVDKYPTIAFYPAFRYFSPFSYFLFLISFFIISYSTK